MTAQLFCQTATAATVGLAGAALWKMNPLLGAAMATVAYTIHSQVAIPVFEAIDGKISSPRIRFGSYILGASWIASLAQIIQWGAANRGYPMPLFKTAMIILTSIVAGEHIGDLIYQGATKS